MQRLTFELRADGRHHFGMAMTDVENPKTAETIDVFATVDIGERVARVGPLDGGIERALRARFPVREEAGIDVIPKAVDGFANDPIRLRAIDRLGMDEV